MKKFASLMAAVLVTTTVLVGCGKSADTNAEATKNDTVTVQEKDFDERGWKGELSITYKDGEIDKVVYDEVNKDGKKKSEDTEYSEKMKAKSGITPKETYDKLAEGAKDGTVDTVTGATSSSDRFKALFEEATAKNK